MYLNFSRKCSDLIKAAIQPVHHQWLPVSEEYSRQFKALKSPSLCQEEFNRNMLLSEDKGAGRGRLSWEKVVLPFRDKTLRRLRRGSPFRFRLPSAIPAPQHNFKHLLFFLYLDILSRKRKAVTLVLLTADDQRFVSLLLSNLRLSYGRWKEMLRRVIINRYGPLG